VKERDGPLVLSQLLDLPSCCCINYMNIIIVILYVCTMQSDLANMDNDVINKGRLLANQLDISCYMTSAKTGQEIDKLFEKAVSHMKIVVLCYIYAFSTSH